MSIFRKLFKTHSEREIKRILPIVDQIEDLSDRYAEMSEEELKSQTGRFRERLDGGETLDDILPEAFAVVREASTRVLGKRHYRVQLIGGIVIHQGRIAEMKTGEGKTLVATLPAYLNALAGKGVHIVTVNDYLARRDSEWMGKIYNYLGLSVGLVIHGGARSDRKAAYLADITYGTNNELGFDYLRDNLVIYQKDMVQREHAFAIVDEVDSILIDEARTPLIISGQGDKSTSLYDKANEFAKKLRAFVIKETDTKKLDDDIDGDYVVDEKDRTAVLTPKGVKKAEQHFGIENLTDPENTLLAHHINQAIKAIGVMHRDDQYIVKDGQVVIVDSFTGRLMPGRRYSDGLHQAIEAKEGVKIEKESKTLATITFQNYFRLYQKLSGMTGTALTEENEFREIYGLDVVEIPTNMPMVRKDFDDRVYRNVPGKYNAIVEEIAERHEKGQPVLVGTVSVDKSEILSKILQKHGVRHNVLNAKFHEKEAEIIAQAGKLGAVTIATNMAGRGTDIMLGGNPEFLAKNKLRQENYPEEMIVAADSYYDTADEEILAVRARYKELLEHYKAEIEPEAARVKEAGGLCIIGTERHESRRIDNQLRGRSGRQGDAGASVFFLSLEDDLMRLFGGDRVTGMVSALGLPEDQPIDAKILSNTIESAQKRLEGQNFGRRKTVLMYDDVMNQQRTVIYKQRREVLDGNDVQGVIRKMVSDSIRESVGSFCNAELAEEWNFEALRAEYLGLITFPDDFKYSAEQLNDLRAEDILAELEERAFRLYQEKEDMLGAEVMREAERVILLRHVDEKWMDHIDAMEDMKSGVGLQAYGQRDPVVEFKLQGSDMFDEMIAVIRQDTVRSLLSIMPQKKIERKMVAQITGESHSDGTLKKAPVRKTAAQKTGRNDPCPCGSGQKYKKCCGKNAPDGAQD